MKSIDLNCDLGEGAGQDAALMPLITSANIGCGAHAGDRETMQQTVALARRHGVGVGAHPGFADRASFGRREMILAPTEIEELVRSQVLTLRSFAAVTHVKPHGALYNQAARDRDVAACIAAAVRSVDPALVLIGLAGSELVRAGEEAGLRVAGEVFADRTYRSDGSLTPRSNPGAFVDDEEEMIRRVIRMVNEGVVEAADGGHVRIRADTVCVHGDGSRAVEFAARLRRDLVQAGIALRGLRDGRA